MSSNAHDALQRGKACLGCRRRKMRCDGARPICTQCSRRNRVEDCEYTDTIEGPTRTQVLEETLARLQARVRELEKPASKPSPPVIPLVDPYSASSSPASDDSRTIPGLAAGGTEKVELKPKLPKVLTPSPPPPERMNIEHVPATPPSKTKAENAWWKLKEPPEQIANLLMRCFLPNSHQLGFALNVPRFLKALGEPSSSPTYPHSSLMNVIYLWALRLSKDPSLQAHENVFLQRAMSALQNVLGGALGEIHDATSAMRVLHVIQAEVLVAQYLFSHERLLEGRYHANAAVSLAVSYGLHRISPPSSESPPMSPSSGVSSSLGLLAQVLSPVQSFVEYGERVNVFWSVYNIDRCWSVVGSPCIMSDDPARGTEINTPWPLDMHEYEMADLHPGAVKFMKGDRTIHRFITGEQPAEGVSDSSYAAFRVKASALYGRASRLVFARKASKPGSQEREEVERDLRELARILRNFNDRIPAVEKLEERVMSSDDRRTIYVVNTIAYCAEITLYDVWAEEGDQASADIGIHAARQVARVPKAGVELGLLDPVLGTCGMILASLWKRELARARSAHKTPESMQRLKMIEEGTEALRQTTLQGTTYAVYGMQVPKILQMLQRK